MRPASYIVIAALAGFVGGNVLQRPELVDKVSGKFAEQKTEPADFWSTPAIAGYGKIHFVNIPDYNPANTPGLSNKIVFQINRSEGDIHQPNLGLERVACVTNLYYTAGVPLLTTSTLWCRSTEMRCRQRSTTISSVKLTAAITLT